MNHARQRQENFDTQDRRHRIRQAEKRQTDNLKRRIEEARVKRKRLLLLLLFILLHSRTLWVWQPIYWLQYRLQPEPTPQSPSTNKLRKIWEPDPSEDFAPEPGTLEYCDGYSREGWELMAEENGLRRSKRGYLIKQWRDDPMRYSYPQRYQDWHLRPNLSQLMVEMREPYWRADAFAAIKLQSPPEVHSYLEEAFALDPADIRQCYSEYDADIIANFKSAALRWEIRKEKEAIEKRRSLDIDDKGLRPMR